MRFRDIIKPAEQSIQENRTHFRGLNIEWEQAAPGRVRVRAMSGDGERELGSVTFLRYDGKKWTGEELHVDERYQRQGIATAMYDWFKEKFGPIRPSDAQTQQGQKFWQGKRVWESKIKLSTDPNWYGAEVGDYRATGPIVNIPTNQLVGFEPDDKMNQPASKANVEKIIAGLKQGAKLPPLLVRKYKNGYQVLDGHHRFWAYKLLGIKNVPAQVVPDTDIEEIGNQQQLKEINAAGQLKVDPSLVERFTSAGWEVLGEGNDQIVLAKPGARTVMKIVGRGSNARQAEIRRYVEFFRAHQRDPHFPRVGPDRELDWNGQKYYAYTQERLSPLSGDEDVLDYLERAMGKLGHGGAPNLEAIPPGLTAEQMQGLIGAVDTMFEAGLGGMYGFDLGNVYNIMQRDNGQLVIVDPFSSFDELDEGTVDDLEKDLKEPYSYDAIDHMMQTIARKNNITAKELHDQFVEKHGMTPDDWIKGQIKENFADKKVKGKSRPGRVKRAGASCKGSVSDLRARAKKYGGERGKMYHWCANMKAGRKNEGRINEVQILSKVKGKGSEPSQLPKFGRPINPKEESRYLGQKQADYRGYEIWRDVLGGQVGYTLFDPDTRQALIYTFGSRYAGNLNSYIVSGLYAAPGNTIKAHEFYRALIQELGLTLVSDRKQSPGGQRVWQRLERYPDVNVYGYDTRTKQVVNIGAGDEEMYAVPPGAAQDRETRNIARNIRLVATAR